MLKAIEMLKNYADVEIFIASILIFINFAPLKPSKRQTKKTIDMKKTLLSALNHGSGILLTIFALLCSCQVWASVTVTNGEVIRVNTNDHGWFKNRNTYPRLYLLNSTSSDEGAVMIGQASGYDSDNIYTITVNIDTDTKTGNYLEVRRYTTDEGKENNEREFYVNSRDAGYSSIYLNTSGTLEWERCFSAGDKFYLLNNASYRVDTDNQLWFQKGSNGKAWIHLWSNPSSGTYDAEFTLLSGEAETSGAIYQASVSGCYAHFLITRNCSGSTGPWAPDNCIWNQSANFSIPPVNNRITGTTSDSYSSDFYLPCTEPTVTTASSPVAKAATTATLTGSYTTEDVCVPTAKGVAYKVDGGSYLYQTDGTSASGSISVSLSELTPRTTYYYKAYVELEGGKKVFGAENSFVTDCMSGVTVSGPSSAGEGPKCSGDSFTALNVTAGGASSYTYQWYYNSSASTSGAIAIPGATSSSYTPAMVGANYYYCSVGAAGGYCEVASGFSGLTTINAVPTLIATPSSVTNYAPVTITASGAEINSWNITSGEGGYLYKKGATSAKFKGNVGNGSPVTYTIQGTANGCSGTTTVTVNKNADSCE